MSWSTGWSPVSHDPPVNQASGPVSPAQGAERIEALDLLRGVALFGILMVNMATFAMPMTAAMTPMPTGEPAHEIAAWAVVRTFFQFKFVSTFSLLFGAGLAIQVARGAARGGFVARYVRRLTILLVFGFIHAHMLWYGDILFWYAVLGAFLLLFRDAKGPVLVKIGAVLVAASAVFFGLIAAVGVVDQHRTQDRIEAAAAAMEAASEADASAGAETNAGTGVEAGADSEGPADTEDPVDADDPADDVGPLRGWRAIAETGNPTDPRWIEAETVAYRDGPWIDAVLFRSLTWAFTLIIMVMGFGGVILGFFILGAGLVRVGFFDPARAPMQATVARWGIGIALPVEIMSTLGVLSGDMMIHAVAEFAHTVAGPGLAVGMVAGITWLSSTGRSRGWDRPIRTAGRAALSVYIGETVLATAIFYHWGLGQFGEIGRLEQLGLVVLIYGVLLAAANVWLRFFRFGPLEWIWRSGTYGRLQPLRR